MQRFSGPQSRGYNRPQRDVGYFPDNAHPGVHMPIPPKQDTPLFHENLFKRPNTNRHFPPSHISEEANAYPQDRYHSKDFHRQQDTFQSDDSHRPHARQGYRPQQRSELSQQAWHQRQPYGENTAHPLGSEEQYAYRERYKSSEDMTNHRPSWLQPHAEGDSHPRRPDVEHNFPGNQRLNPVRPHKSSQRDNFQPPSLMDIPQHQLSKSRPQNEIHVSRFQRYEVPDRPDPLCNSYTLNLESPRPETHTSAQHEKNQLRELNTSQRSQSCVQRFEPGNVTIGLPQSKPKIPLDPHSLNEERFTHSQSQNQVLKPSVADVSKSQRMEAQNLSRPDNLGNRSEPFSDLNKKLGPPYSIAKKTNIVQQKSEEKLGPPHSILKKSNIEKQKSEENRFSESRTQSPLKTKVCDVSNKQNTLPSSDLRLDTSKPVATDNQQLKPSVVAREMNKEVANSSQGQMPPQQQSLQKIAPNDHGTKTGSSTPAPMDVDKPEVTGLESSMKMSDAVEMPTVETSSQNADDGSDDKKEESPFNCDLCNVKTNCYSQYQNHIHGIKHKKKVRARDSAQLTSQESASYEETGSYEEMDSYEDIYDDDNNYDEEDCPIDFHCDICNVQMTCHKNYQDHINGLKHKKMMKKLYPDSPAIGSKETNEATVAKTLFGLGDVSKAFSEDYYCDVCDVSMCSYGNYKDHLTGSKHNKKVKKLETDPNSQKPKLKIEKTSDTNDTMSKKQKQLSLTLKDLMVEATAPLIGLQYVTEFQPENNVLPAHYVCNLCQSRSDANIMLAHIRGTKHRRKYMEHHFMNYIIQLKFENLKVKHQTDRLDEYAHEIQQQEGRKEYKVKVELDPFFSDRCVLKAAGMNVNKKNIIEPKKGQIATFQKRINNIKAPLIGLEYITEFHIEGSGLAPRYVCHMCEIKCDAEILTTHITGSKHRLAYLEENHFSVHREFLNNIDKKGLSKGEISEKLHELTTKYEKEDGRGTIQLQIEHDQELVDALKEDALKGTKSKKRKEKSQEDGGPDKKQSKITDNKKQEMSSIAKPNNSNSLTARTDGKISTDARMGYNQEQQTKSLQTQIATINYNHAHASHWANLQQNEEKPQAPQNQTATINYNHGPASHSANLQQYEKEMQSAYDSRKNPAENPEAVLKNLSSSMVKSDSDADMAMHVSKSLMKALINYRLKQDTNKKNAPNTNSTDTSGKK